MRFHRFLSVFLLALLLTGAVLPTQTLGATDLADGKYTVQYTVLHASNDSASIANDYWDKPATLIVNNGVITVQMQLNHSDWIKTFQVGGKDVQVVSTNSAADTRVVQFQASDLSSPLVSQIHVVVPDIDYDNHYTIRLSFDMSTLNQVEGGSGNSTSSSTEDSQQSGNNAVSGSSGGSGGSTTGNDSAEVSNPQTSDAENVYLFAALLLISAALLFFSRKWRKAVSI
ncbi:heme uptake protein IsdC [Evansella caseinilytica]|uniref:Heme uptake protein IsdC n=1 Tax=Evansella caseinilytica TaxID=1503961 RepID=A0A1H3REV0_9BACI|nr:heme uptake protein IsdC [Evansella caseinilytica]SDZ23855.1 heme uptake protein IsdC [Evansella caseinilytica]